MGNGESKSIENRAKEVLNSQIQAEINAKNHLFMKRQAYELASARERFSWEAPAAVTLALTLVYFASVHKKRFVSIGIPPLVMAIGYRYETCYGDLNGTVKDTADHLLNNHPERFQLTDGPITTTELENRINSWKEILK